MTRLRKDGTTRLVWCVGRLAFKIARGRLGARCNRYEANYYRDASPECRAKLCPPLWCSPFGVVLVMPRAEPIAEDELDDLLNTGRIPFFLDDDAEDEDSPFEFGKASDWGRLDGRIVALDYSANVALGRA
jgi:hypothetical protein